MYRIYPSLVLGFHLCERETGEKILAEKDALRPSNNDYDWLGHGVYFWENSPDRARQFARDLQKTKWRRKEPFVLGAVIYLGRCFDLLDMYCLDILKKSFRTFTDTIETACMEMPKNHSIPNGHDSLFRKLDCAVFEHMHQQLKGTKHPSYDSVRGAFWEGKELYPGAGFKEKNHVQICVRNPNCIKGYFRELKSLDRELYVGL